MIDPRKHDWRTTRAGLLIDGLHTMTQDRQAPKPPRIRTNRTTTSKGIPSYDLTFESEGIIDYPQDKLDADIAEHLRRFDELTAEMDARTVVPEVG